MTGGWKITLRGDAAFGLLREGRKQCGRGRIPTISSVE